MENDKVHRFVGLEQQSQDALCRRKQCRAAIQNCVIQENEDDAQYFVSGYRTECQNYDYLEQQKQRIADDELN